MIAPSYTYLQVLGSLRTSKLIVGSVEQGLKRLASAFWGESRISAKNRRSVSHLS